MMQAEITAELVDRLAYHQTEAAYISERIAQDKEIQEYVGRIADLEIRTSNMRDDLYDLKSVYGLDSIEKKIEDTKAQIIESWSGDAKTIVYKSGTLKFRTTQSLNIIDPEKMLTSLVEHLSIRDIVAEYVTGFNKTAVKQYMGVIHLPTDVAELEAKTSVRLDTTEVE